MEQLIRCPDMFLW